MPPASCCVQPRQTNMHLHNRPRVCYSTPTVVLRPRGAPSPLLAHSTLFFFNDPAPPEISTLPLPAALPIPADYNFTSGDAGVHTFSNAVTLVTAGNQSVTATDTSSSSITGTATVTVSAASINHLGIRDRTSTRLNSSHQITSYAVFCFKKKN